MKNILILLLIITGYSTISAGYNETQIATQTDTIKFQLNEHNNISVQAILNEIDTLSLMFHTDISSVSLTPDKSEEFRVTKNEKSSQATSWTGTGDVAYVEKNTLAISNFKWEDITVWLDMLSGPDTDGKFGPNLFKGKIIEINYDENILVLHDFENLKLDTEKFNSFNLKANEHNSLIVEGKMMCKGSIIKHDFILHSGYGGTIILDDAIQKANKIFSELTVIDENVLKDSFGNEIQTKKVVLESFEMFNYELKNLPLSYFDSELEIQKTSVIGRELLKRFNLFIDMENMKIHVAENGNTKVPFKIT